MKIPLILSSLALACLVAFPAMAAEPAPSKADRQFAKAAAVGGMMEVKLGAIAEKQAASADVKKFGAMMVTQHTQAGDELKAIAAKQGLKLPASLPKKKQAKVDEMAKLQGQAFDKTYIDTMVTAHQADLAAFREEAKNGTDPELKAFAAKTAEMVEHHLQVAEKIHATLK